MLRHGITIRLAAALVVLASVANAQAPAACQPSWVPTFGPEPGFTSGAVRAFAVYDAGAGPALYAGGSFESAGGAFTMGIACWNGSSWAGFGEGVDGTVLALTVFDDGSGPALYAGGSFTTAGGVPAGGIARWTSAGWSAVGDGAFTLGAFPGEVRALTVFDDGSGLALYAAGQFTSVGGVAAARIAKWDGASWSALGSGLDGTVNALAVFDDGGGGALYAGGQFIFAGGLFAGRLARWDGQAWSAIGGGASAEVLALEVYDEGGSNALYAGGAFSFVDGVPASFVARWMGASWSALGLGTDDWVHSLRAFHDGTGPRLAVGGAFTKAGGSDAYRIASWSGSAWKPIGPGFDKSVRALAVFDDGSGPALVAGGGFLEAYAAGSLPGGTVNRAARWNGSDWLPLGAGLNGPVYSLFPFDDGGGTKLFVGGDFSQLAGVAARGVASWSAAGAEGLAGGVDGEVHALAAFDDGGGPALYVGGWFSEAGGSPASGIARWDGAGWSALGSGVSSGEGVTGDVHAMAAFDDGSGPALYVAGSFDHAGGMPADNIARWDGASWSTVGGGMDGAVYCLEVFDDGSGPALYAGGVFTLAGGAPASRLAKWDGAAWSEVGGGVSIPGDFYSPVEALRVFDDGSGPALFVGGKFKLAGSTPAVAVARWDGAAWSAVVGAAGTGTHVRALVALDDGTGEKLFAGGGFASIDGVSALCIAAWDGAAWSPLDSGVINVHALEAFDDGSGPALFAGGWFPSMKDTPDSYLAKWGGCPEGSTAWTDLGFALAGASGPPRLLGTGTLEAGSAGSLSLTGAKSSSLALLAAATSGAPTAFACGSFVPVPVVLAIHGFTSITGVVAWTWPSWPAGLSGHSLYLQAAIVDPGASCGVALSNALRADVP